MKNSFLLPALALVIIAATSGCTMHRTTTGTTVAMTGGKGLEPVAEGPRGTTVWGSGFSTRY